MERVNLRNVGFAGIAQGKRNEAGPKGSLATSNRTPAVAQEVEVAEKPARRRFTAAYKLQILEEADACNGTPGALGALLRREGLYFSHLSTWRRQREEATSAGLTPKKRGRKKPDSGEQSQRIKRLEQENQRLRRKLRQAETILEIQKRASELLGIPLSRQERGDGD